MGLRQKARNQLILRFSILLALFLFFAVIFLFQNNKNVEIIENKKNMERTMAAIAMELRGLESSSADWAYWTETYNFALGLAPEYIQSNLTKDTFINLKLNLMGVLDNRQRILYAEAYNADKDTLSITSNEVTNTLSMLYPEGGDPTGIAKSGILVVGEYPMLIVSRPILKSDRSGPPGGLFIIGRSLDETELEKISEIVQLPVRYAVLNRDGTEIEHKTDSVLDDEFGRFQKAINDNIRKGKEKDTTVVLPLGLDKIASYKIVKDIEGLPSLLFKTENTRELHRRERQGIFFFVICLLLTAALNVVFFVRSIKKNILNPILKMEQGLTELRSQKGTGLLADISDSQDDEIAGLARSVNGRFAEVNELNSGLEEKVKRRTLELEIANEELSAFSYSVAHDLRAPLRSIEGFSQIFLDEYGSSVPEKGLEYLERVRRNTVRMGGLIDDLLKLSQVSSTELSSKSIDLSALAAEVTRELVADNPARNVNISIEPSIRAVGDPNLLRVVLSNLLGNAWKFTSKNSYACIGVGTIMDPQRGPAFFVKDNGSGFDNAYKGKLFAAFHRLHSDKEFPGTGIGLAIVARIIHRHGGEVWAEGETGKGATFYFTIPT